MNRLHSASSASILSMYANAEAIEMTVPTRVGAPAPLVTVLLPLAFALHIVEEWYGGFLAWTPVTLGYQISFERFLIINATGLALAIIGSLAAIRHIGMTWFAASLAALLGLNGLLHILATIVTGTYAPGAITGLVLYIPLSVIVLRLVAARVSRPVFVVSILAGIVLHGFVSIVAFM